MSGIFDFVNHPNPTEGQQTINSDFLRICFYRRQFGLSTAVQLLALINLELGSSGPLTPEAEGNLVSLRNWVNAASSNDLRSQRIDFIAGTFAGYEQSKPDGTPWLTEAEARTMFATMGVSF